MDALLPVLIDGRPELWRWAKAEVERGEAKWLA
jgi:hypothetical protein